MAVKKKTIITIIGVAVLAVIGAVWIGDVLGIPRKLPSPLRLFYYEVNGKCYAWETSPDSRKIGVEVKASQIGDPLAENSSFYEIKGSADEQEIAMNYVGRYYRLSFVAGTRFSFQGKTYTFDPETNLIEGCGGYMGETSEGLKCYHMPGTVSTDTIAVELKKDAFYGVAHNVETDSDAK